MIITKQRENDRGRGSGKQERNQKILVSSRFHYYEPTSNSLSIPVMVFDDVTTIDLDNLKACIIANEKKVMFLMSGNYNYYIVSITDSFIKLVKNYKQIIIADKTIYTGKEDSHSGIRLPLYINE